MLYRVHVILYNNLEILDRSVKRYNTYKGEENAYMGGQLSERKLEEVDWIDLAQARTRGEFL